MNELFLDGASAGHMNLVGVLHVAGDLLEKLVLQGALLVLLGVLVGIAVRARIAGVAHYRKFFGAGVGVADDGGMMIIHPNTKLLFMIY